MEVKLEPEEKERGNISEDDTPFGDDDDDRDVDFTPVDHDDTFDGIDIINENYEANYTAGGNVDHDHTSDIPENNDSDDDYDPEGEDDKSESCSDNDDEDSDCDKYVNS